MYTVFLIAPKFIKSNERLNSKIMRSVKTIIALIWHFSKKMWGRSKGGILNRFAQTVAWGEDETYNRLKNNKSEKIFKP